jgi:hypothetical protein
MDGLVIRRNTISSNQGGAGPVFGIRSNSATDDLLAMILDNRICAINDAILNFKTNNVQGNIVGVGGLTPTDESGFND